MLHLVQAPWHLVLYSGGPIIVSGGPIIGCAAWFRGFVIGGYAFDGSFDFGGGHLTTLVATQARVPRASPAVAALVVARAVPIR